MSKKKKLFVISDVHGHYGLLKEALDKAGFDENNEDHLLVGCGDYFDRGNENAEVLQFLEAQKHKVLLCGNHEDLLLNLLITRKFLPHNAINGTASTLANIFGEFSIAPVTYAVRFKNKEETVLRLRKFIFGTVNYFETENYVFVHGWIPENVKSAEELAKASDKHWEKARWIKWIDKYNGKKPLKDKTLVCGHYPTFCAAALNKSLALSESGIFYGNGLIAIDAGTFDTKKINILVLEDNVP